MHTRDVELERIMMGRGQKVFVLDAQGEREGEDGNEKLTYDVYNKLYEFQRIKFFTCLSTRPAQSQMSFPKI